MRVLLAVVGGVLFAVSLALLAASADAATGDGWRWPRYDQRTVKVRVVVDQAGLLPAVRSAARLWEASGDLRLEVDRRPVGSCEQRPGTICVTASPDASVPNWGGSLLYGSYPGGVLNVGSDGLPLLSYVRVWVNTAHVSTAGEYADILCHELGHAVGLGHPVEPFQKPSCMAEIGVSPLPSVEDLVFLHSLYAVRDAR